MKKSTFLHSISIESNYNLSSAAKSSEGAKLEVLGLINKNKDMLVDRIKQEVVDNIFTVKHEGNFTKRFIKIPTSTSTIRSVSLKKDDASIIVVEDAEKPQVFNATEQEIQEYAIDRNQPTYVFYGNGIFILSDGSYAPSDTGITYALTSQDYPADYTLSIFDTNDDKDINDDVESDEPMSLLPPEAHQPLVRMVVRDILNSPIIGGTLPQAQLDRADIRVENEILYTLRILKERNTDRLITMKKPISRYS